MIRSGAGCALALLAAACAPTVAQNPLSPGAVLAVDAGSASLALNNGTTLTAPSKMGTHIRTNYGPGGAVTRSADGEFSIKRNSSGGIDVVVGGTAIAFADTDAMPDGGMRKQGTAFGETRLYSFSGDSVQQTLDSANPNYSQIWGYYGLDTAQQVTNNGYFVVGTETKPEALANRASATYTGVARFDGPDRNYPGVSNTLEAGTERARAINPNSSFVMNADFSGRTVEGAARGLVITGNGQPAAGANFAGDILFRNGQISGNGFNGQIVLANNPNAGGSGTFTGAFFGPDAEEIAGTTTLDTYTHTAQGFFRAER